MGRYVLAIDSGTTSTRSVVVDPDGRIVASASEQITQYFPQLGWVEHDPEEIWRGVLTTMRSALAHTSVRASDLVGLGITNQRETVVAWERATGRPVHRAIVWQDRRGADACATLQREGASTLVMARTGLHLDPYFSATKIAWILDHVAGLRQSAQRGEICVGTIDSWILWRLSGGRVHATDATNASRTSLMDLRRVAWDDELCRLFDVPREVLPSIERSESFFAETDADVLGGAVPITGILGDQQAALLGQGCVRVGQTKSTYGTGSFVLQHTGTQVLTETGSLIATAAGTENDAPQEYALEGSIFVTGAAIQWLRDALGIIDTVEESEALAASLEDNGDVWFVPALTGLGAPQWDPHARGTVLGITRGTTRAHLARAALEGIAYQTRDVIDEMNIQSRVALRELKVDGAATSNRWLMQFQSDVLGVPVVVAPHAEATALGVAFAAGVRAGLWSRHDELGALLGEGVRYEPTMSTDERDALYSRWTQALDRSRGWSQ
ncbi:MAG: glycerol kinase GlpK [Acidimicrobiaceae bacterium]|nr:glycerol kinase GlpK [Acidimicrobiaceae bacterium]